MNKEFVKENIELFKDLLKGLFTLFILIGSGGGALLVKKTFLTDKFEYNILVICFIIDIILFLLMVTLFIYLYHHIKKLKSNGY